MVPPNSDRITRVPPYFSLATVPHVSFSRTGLSPTIASLSSTVR